MLEYKAERSGIPRYFIQVAKETGGIYEPDPHAPNMFIQKQLVELAATNALGRFPVVRVLKEEVVYRRSVD